MGLFDNFFGGSKSKTKIQQLDMLNAEQKALLKQMIDQYGTAVSKPSPSAPNMYAGPTSAEQQLSSWAKSQAVKDMLSGKVPYEVGPEYAKQYFENTIRAPMISEWQKTVLPQLRESFAGPGYWSTDRMRQESESAQKLAEDLNAKQSELMYSEELARRQAVENAMNRVVPTQQAVGTVGTMERDIEHEKVMDAVTRFLMGESVDGNYQPAYNPNVAIALSLLGIQPFTYGTTSTSQGAGLGYGLLTGAAEGAGYGLTNWLFK